MNKTFFDVRVAHDSTGPHFEYYATLEDLEDGYGYPIDTLRNEILETVLFEIRNGLYAEIKVDD